MSTGSIRIGLAVLIVAAIGGIASLVKALRDRSDLRLKVEYDETGLGSELQVILVNYGKRAVQVDKVLLYFKSGKELPYSQLSRRNANLPPKLPVTLEESDPCNFRFPLYDIRQLGCDPLEFKRAEVFDTLRNKYSFPTLTIKSRIKFLMLKQQTAKGWSPQSNAPQQNDG